MELGEAVLKLTTDNSSLNEGLKDSKEKSNALVGELQNLVKAYLSFEGLKKVVEFLKDSVAEYLKSVDSITKLSSALKATGDNSSASLRNLADYAAALQNTTKFTHEATEGALSMLMTLGGLTASMAEKAIPAIQDFSTAMGVDLQASATLVSKAMEGNVGALGRYGIHVKAGADAAENLSIITGELEKKFGGLALAIGNTASGKMTQLANAFTDIKEEIGRAIVTAFEPFIAWLGNVTKGIASAMKAANDLREALKNQEKGIADTNDKLVIATANYLDVNTRLHNFTDTMWLANNAQAAMSEVTSHGFSVIADYVHYLQQQNTAARNTMNGIEDLARREKEAAEARAADLKRLADIEAKRWEKEQKNRQTNIDLLEADTKANATWADVVLSRLRLVHDAELGADQVTNKTWADYVAWIEKAATSTKTLADQMGAHADKMSMDWDRFAKRASDAMRSVFSEIGKDLAQGTLTWKSFGEAAVHAIGRIVSAIGDQLAASAAADLVIAIADAASIVLAAAAPGFFSSAAIKGAGAAAAWMAGAALESVSLEKGGEFTVPPGYPDDSFHANLSSGEKVKVTPAGEAGADMIHVVVNLNERPILDCVTKGSRNRQVLISAASVVQ